MRENSLLGKGTYGCIYKPPISCKYLKDLNQKNENNIMKVVDTSINSNILEIEISAIIRQIDPENEYFLSYTGENCLIDQDIKELKSCSAYQKNENRLQIRGYFLKYGGPTLQWFIKNVEIDVGITWKWMKNLIEGISLLHDNNIVHLDIKSNNIIIDENDNTAKFIDFGLSAFASDYELRKWQYRSFPLFYVAQLDIDIKTLYDKYEYLAKFFNKKYKKNTDEDIIRYFYHTAKNRHYFNNAIKSNNFYMDPKIKPKFNRKAGIFKIDVYILMNMFNNYITLPNYDLFENENKVLFDKINFCIDNGVNIYPDKQYTSQALLKYIKNNSQEEN